jgi:hypothetical protein
MEQMTTNTKAVRNSLIGILVVAVTVGVFVLTPARSEAALTESQIQDIICIIF